jgi:hypothetical protein
VGTYGCRVPAFVISPWVKGASVFGHDGIVAGGGGGTTGGSLGGVVTSSSSATPNPPAGGAATNPPLANQFRSLYFDHTSILKTIARRFMSQKPPYLSPRYADANDLSSVLGTEMRPSQFRPFIGYNFVYGPSQKRLDVQFGNASPGAILWQYDPNTTPAQQFSFEDAGNGFWYIRTHTGSLYLTATPTGVKQDVKYPPRAVATALNNPDTQRWLFTSTGLVVTQRDIFTISNAAFPGLVLQPSGDSNNSGVSVVLAPPVKARVGVLVPANPWQVTSPLLPSGNIADHGDESGTGSLSSGMRRRPAAGINCRLGRIRR